MIGPIALPKLWRPESSYYRRVVPGLDFPTSFVLNLKAIHCKLNLVYHPYRLLWDSVINQYSGMLEDPRYEIHNQYGELNFGFVLTDGKGAPVFENRWHIWELTEVGWAHVLKVESQDEEYCQLLLNRLYLQSRFHDKYGKRGYSKKLSEDEEAFREKQKDDQEDLFQTIQKENSFLLKKAAENFDRGTTAPTNPTKDIITSYKGQTNRSRIVRPITDKEGGLVN